MPNDTNDGKLMHPHSVLNLSKKKNSKLNPQLPFGHVFFKTSFFCEASICLSGLLNAIDVRCHSQYSETLVVFRNESKEKAGNPLSDMWLNIQNPGC